jgi:hypothetical protein
MSKDTSDKGENMSEATVIDTPAGIQNFMFLRFMHMIALELNTGMSHSGGPVLRQLFRAGLIDADLRGTKKNKTMVLEAMVEQYKEIYPGWEASASVRRALGEVIE